MVKNYDFVVTSGGIGPTHVSYRTWHTHGLYSTYPDAPQDDITYQSLAKAFDMPLTLNDETAERMQANLKARGMISQQNEEQKKARERMALFPTGGNAEVLFVADDKWVPVVRLMGKVSLTNFIGRGPS